MDIYNIKYNKISPYHHRLGFYTTNQVARWHPQKNAMVNWVKSCELSASVKFFQRYQESFGVSHLVTMIMEVQKVLVTHSTVKQHSWYS